MCFVDLFIKMLENSLNFNEFLRNLVNCSNQADSNRNGQNHIDSDRIWQNLAESLKYDPNSPNKADSFATLIFFRDFDFLSRPSATALLIQRVGGYLEIVHLSGSPGGTLLFLRFS